MSEPIQSAPQTAVTAEAARAAEFPAWAIGLVVVGAMIPAALVVFVVRRYGVDVPYYDEWGMTGLIRKSLEGTLHLRDFYFQYSGHRLVIPQMLLLATARATGWDTRYELILNLVAGLSIASVFGLRAAAMAQAYRAWQCLVMVPVFSLLVLSLAQFENWMWGWQIQIFLVVLASTSSLFLLSGPRLGYVHLGSAVVLAIVATFSFGNGMLTWPLGLVALLYPGFREGVRPRRVFVLVWVLVAATVFAAYFHDFSMPPPIGNTTGERSAATLIKYLCAFLGAPFALFKVSQAIAIGAFGIVATVAMAAYLVCVRPVRPAEYLPGALVWLFGLGSGLLTAVGRAQFGASQALSSRYVTISMLFWIGATMMFAAAIYGPAREERQSFRVGRWARAAFLTLIAAMSLATIRADVAGVESIRQFSHLERALRFKLLKGDRDESLLLLAPDLKWLNLWVEVARTHHFWAWRPNAPASMFEEPPPAYREL